MRTLSRIKFLQPRMVLRILTLFLFLGTGATSVFAEKTPSYKYGAFYLVGHELRILMQTYVLDYPFYAHGYTVRDKKDWLVCVDLSSERPLAQRSKIYGPLLKDDAYEEATVFDPEGNVLRIRKFYETKTTSTLKFDADTAYWAPNLPRSVSLQPGDREPMLSRRYNFLERGEKDEPQLYDVMSGKQVSNPWLETAFATYRGMKDMGFEAIWITDDCKFLVCWPYDGWSVDRKPVKNFEWAGKPYDRMNWAFYFKAGETEPVVIEKPVVNSAKSFQGVPTQALSIDGHLYLLYEIETGTPSSEAKKQALLLSLTGGESRTVTIPKNIGDGWLVWPFDRRQHDENSRQLIFFGEGDRDKMAYVFFWNYNSGQFVRYAVPTSELFHTSIFGKFVPNKAYEVRAK